MRGNTDQFNVVCLGCGSVWTPAARSRLWWKAKKHAESGKLDALHVGVEECGCVEPQRQPDAPYRVFGFTDDCHDFDYPFYSFTAAIKKYRDESSGLSTVFISGVSPAVEGQLI